MGVDFSEAYRVMNLIEDKCAAAAEFVGQGKINRARKVRRGIYNIALDSYGSLQAGEAIDPLNGVARKHLIRIFEGIILRSIGLDEKLDLMASRNNPVGRIMVQYLAGIKKCVFTGDLDEASMQVDMAYDDLFEIHRRNERRNIKTKQDLANWLYGLGEIGERIEYLKTDVQKNTREEEA